MRFKIGEKVVALMSDTAPAYFKKDDVLEVVGIKECVNGILLEGSPCWYDAKYFAPLQNNTDAIEYKMKVSIPELLTIKEYQEQ